MFCVPWLILEASPMKVSVAVPICWIFWWRDWRRNLLLWSIRFLKLCSTWSRMGTQNSEVPCVTVPAPFGRPKVSNIPWVIFYWSRWRSCCMKAMWPLKPFTYSSHSVKVQADFICHLPDGRVWSNIVMAHLTINCTLGLFKIPLSKQDLKSRLPKG